MIFGLSLTKALVILSLGLFLFGVPLMSFLVTLRERRDEEARKGAHRWDR